MIHHRELSILLIFTCLIIFGCRSTSSDSDLALSEMVSNSTWYNYALKSDFLSLYQRHQFEDSLVTTKVLPFPCGLDVDLYGIDDTTRTYQIIDDSKLIIGGEEFQVKKYSKEEISLNVAVNNLDSTITFKKQCAQL